MGGKGSGVGGGDKSVPMADRAGKLRSTLSQGRLPAVPALGEQVHDEGRGGKDTQTHHFSTSTLQLLACANSWFTRVSSVSKCFL